MLLQGKQECCDVNTKMQRLCQWIADAQQRSVRVEMFFINFGVVK
jgi:hypothetical protein